MSATLCRSCGLASSLAATFTVLLAASGFSFYALARQVAPALQSFAAAVLYMVLPYHLMLDYVLRSAISEFSVYVWMPVILCAVLRWRDDGRFVLLAGLGYAGLITAHIPSALLFSPVMFLFALLQAGPRVWSLLYLVLAVALGLALAAPYLLPALTTQDLINASGWWQLREYQPEAWLWLSSDPVPRDGVILVALLPTTILLAYSLRFVLPWAPERRPLAYLLAAIGLGSWFMMLSPSAPLWEHLPLIRKVQFPWRVAILIDLATALAFALALTALAQRNRGALGLFLIAGILVGAPYAINGRNIAQSFAAVSPERYQQELAFAELIGSTREYLPIQAFESLTEEAQAGLMAARPGLAVLYGVAQEIRDLPEVEVVAGEAQISLRDATATTIDFDIEAESDAVLRFSRFYYPIWRLTEPGADPPVAFALAPAPLYGLIEAEVPKGSYSLRLETAMLDQERWGWMLFWAGVAAMVFVLVATPMLRRRAP